jgi:hypothetical protein
MAKAGHTEAFQVISLWDDKQKRNVNVRIDFDVDWAKLARKLGSKAWRNSTKKSAMLQGSIKAEAREWNK